MYVRKPTHQTIEQLQKLLEEKYINLNVKIEAKKADEIRILLLNGRHGVDEGIDEENERPIEYLSSFGATVTKEKSKHVYWSNSVITLKASKINDVIQGLEIMPNQKTRIGKIMAMC